MPVVPQVPSVSNPVNAPVVQQNAGVNSAAVTTPTAVPVSNMTVSQQEMEAYEAAFGQIKQKKYSDAIQSLSDYLTQYPTGAYVANAHYWLGELYAISGASDKAISELTLVTTNFANSDKAPNAMLKLGNMAYDQNNLALAKDWWQKVQKQYSNTSAARVASTRLQQLEKAGQ